LSQRSTPAEPPPGAGLYSGSSGPSASKPSVLVIEADDLMYGVLDGHLRAAGYALSRHVDPDRAARAPGERYDLVIVDVPLPLERSKSVVRRIVAEYSDTPVLALSPLFTANVACTGAVAQTFGIAGCLPMPFTRDALIAAVRRSLGARAS
jgi:DNA-binding response OmpR family regulator